MRAVCCNSVYIMCYCSMKVPIALHTHYNMADIKALVDLGATDNFVSTHFLKEMGIKTHPLDKPKQIYNIDNNANKVGKSSTM